MAGILVFARTDQFSIALAVLWTMIMVRRMYGPLLAVWINPQLAAPVRATVLSIRGQMDSFGQMGGGPILGAIATLRTIPYALIVSVVFLIPALGLYVRSFFSNHKS
jgi:DHA3 family tetracycline resistance protein-like MFS transporter